MKEFSHKTSKEVKRIRLRLNKEFSDQQKQYQREHDDLIAQIEELQQKTEYLQKEYEQKKQKR